jgi:2,3-bisphosphoglycerate-dependent phosphoglycerate mutase
VQSEHLELWLIRHGETDWNREQRAQGHLDVPLSKLGLEQAKLLAARLASVHFDALYSSDLGRAFETANTVGRVLQQPVRIDGRWREIHLGVVQGLTYPEIKARGMHRQNRNIHEPWEGGESQVQLMERASAAMVDIRSNHSRGRVAVFTHGGTIRAALHSLLEDPEHRIAFAERGNTSITKLRLIEGDAGRARWILVSYNDTAHLEPMEHAVSL